MGKIQFHRKVEKRFKAQKDKTFSQRIDNQKLFVYETQAIQKRELESKESSSEEEHKVNALALGAEEGRDKLR